MHLVESYLLKKALYLNKIPSNPNKNLEIIIVIPCYNEHRLLDSLFALKNALLPDCSIEVIVIINSSSLDSEIVINKNKLTYNESVNWSITNSTEELKYYILNFTDLKPKDAGVGLARKIGMDIAVERFNKLKKNDGIIVCFDADSLCEKNYLIEITNHFRTNKKTNACSIYYEHPICGSEFSEKIYDGIIQYELYLRYYMQALRYANFPYSYHTIGSSFAVKVEAYVKQGGMNKRKAGEDFYFLQKIIPLGNFSELNSTSVIPSPRESDRVPFGTGCAIKKWIENNNNEYYTYNLNSFLELKILFSSLDKIYFSKANYLDIFSTSLSSYMIFFLNENDFDVNIVEFKNHSTDFYSFKKRFFNWFNAFKCLKCLNYLVDNFEHKKINESAIELLSKLNININNGSCIDLLLKYREIEKFSVLKF